MKIKKDIKLLVNLLEKIAEAKDYSDLADSCLAFERATNGLLNLQKYLNEKKDFKDEE